MALFDSLLVKAEAVSFDELVQHGLDSGANVHNGMPWSFMWMDHPITHETDDLYLIATMSDLGDIKIGRKDMLLDIAGAAVAMPKATFDALFIIAEQER